MIAALIIAATLQSAQIGEFFTLPAWLPRTVGSHDTPGSDPLYNPTNGWYVAEYTNALSRSSWTCSCFGITSVRDLDFLSGNSEWRIYYAVDEMLRMAYPEGEFGITDVTPAYVCGPYEREIIDIGNVVVSNWNGTALVEVARSPFYATRNKTPVPTGRRVPRAARLTPEVQAGVNSTIEGWCERLYYASQGQSNVWDTAVYGGTSPSTFRFPIYYVDEVPRYSIASNRTVTTRRLIEHTNICEYATIFLDYHKQRWEFETSKPGWVPYSGNAFIYWSSTAPALREHGDSRAFIPTFSDSADPTAGSTADEWKISCPTFCRLKGDDVWERDAWEWSNPEPHPCIDLMSNVSFNQSFYHPERCAWANTNNLTMAHLITNAYPFVRSGGITNETRRLISDRLCEMNQYLGLMNSTYVVNTLTYPTEGTNTHYETEVTCEGIPSVSWTWNPYQHEFEGTFGGIEWLSPQETNRITKSSRQQSGCIHHRIEGTTTSYELDTYGREYSIPIPGPTSDDVESIASSFLYDLGRDHVYFEMEIVPEYWNGTPRITYTVTEWILPTIEVEVEVFTNTVTNTWIFTNSATNDWIFTNSVTGVAVFTNTVTNTWVFTNTVQDVEISDNGITNDCVFINGVTAVDTFHNSVTNEYAFTNDVTFVDTFTNVVTNVCVSTDTSTDIVYFGNTETNVYVFINSATNSCVFTNCETNVDTFSNSVSTDWVFTNTVPGSAISAVGVPSDWIFTNSVTSVAVFTNTVTNTWMFSNSATNDYVFTNAVIGVEAFTNTVTNVITVASGVTNVYHFTVVPDSNSIGRVNSVYTRSYAYAHTFGDMVIGATQPGRDAGDRAITNMLGIVTGIHYREDSIPDSLSNMYWYDVWSHSIYSSRQLAYATRADIVRELQTSADDLLFAKVISMYGWDPTDWRNIIQITDEARVRQSTQLTNIRLNVQQNTREPFGAPAKTRVLGWCFSEPYRCEVYSVETEYSEGRTESGYCDFWAGCPTFEYENETPNEYEHDGLAVDAKLGVITRTDWNWKALRRTDDNP